MRRRPSEGRRRPYVNLRQTDCHLHVMLWTCPRELNGHRGANAAPAEQNAALGPFVAQGLTDAFRIVGMPRCSAVKKTLTASFSANPA